MTTDTRNVTTRRLVVDTNVFELGELKSIAWRVFGPTSASDAVENAQTTREDVASSLASFAAFADAINHVPTAVTTWTETTDPRLWVFSINHAQPLPTPSTQAQVESEGTWNGEDTSFDTIRPYLFRALHQWLGKRLLTSNEFRVDGDLFCLNEARFVYRRPSLVGVNQFNVFLDEAFATSGVTLHFDLLPNRCLCVNVEMMHQDAAAAAITPEIGGLATAWMRLMGLPGDQDYSMVDVWHTDDLLAARVVAETKYDDIYPRFRTIPRRKLGRRKGLDGGDDGGGDDDDGTGKNGKADGTEDGGNDENDGTNDGDDDRRNGALGKKKRRKPVNDAAENDESIIPVSPDTHVNSPDISGPVVRMTFPHDRPLLLHTDHDIHIYKRRRRKKTESVPITMNGSRATPAASLSFGPLNPALATNGTKSIMPILGRARSVSQTSSTPQTPETPKTPALSLAVSLVASLTQDEEREVLDCKPIKIHPLLQALDDYVEEEMAAHASRSQAIPIDHVNFVPNAPGFSPSIDEKKKVQVTRLSSSRVSYEQLRSQLLSDRFKRYLTGYYPRDFTRSKRQQCRERERKLLIEFDEAKLLEYEPSAATSLSKPGGSVRDQEIALGVHLAALDALVPWNLHGAANARWIPYASSSVRAADERDTLTLVHHITPHLTELQGVVKQKYDGDTASDEEAGEVHDPWMTLERYCAKTIDVDDDSADEMHAKLIDSIPRVCVSTIESALHVEIPAISEYTLRGFQPVAAAKPVDYAIVCPHSPAQWLGTLTLSYLSMFRSTYAQSAMGDQVALDLSSLSSSASVHVDAANALMLVECTTNAEDAFATVRAAGELLRPVLSQGMKSKQAFSRTPVANVVYLVAPFRRSDIKHKLWLLGAFGCGLFGENGVEGCEDDWSKTVTLELLYLEDLIAVSVDANPFILLPAAMALYDRIFERVTLKPITNGEGTAKSRFVCERLYHLADVQSLTEANGTSDSTTVFVHAGYAVSSDGQWLLTACCDALGAVLETRAISIVAGDISSAVHAFVASALEFVALMGEKASLAISQLLPSSSAMSVGADTWRELAEQDDFQQLIRRFESVVSRIIVYQTSFVDKTQVHLRPVASTIVKVNEYEGVLVVHPDDPSAMQECSRVSNTKWLRSLQRPVHHTTVLRVRLVHSISVSDSTAVSREDLELVLTDWSSLSYLTTHPIFLQRLSPLPLHLAAVDELYSELELLNMQLTTDPLVLRR